MEDEGNVLKYMTKCEMGKQRSCLLIMTQRLFVKERMLVLAIVYIIIAFSYYKTKKGGATPAFAGYCALVPQI